MKVASSKSGIITIEDYDENKHPWVNTRMSPLGDKLKYCSTHSKMKQIVIKESESWDEEPEIETKPNYDDSAKWSVWTEEGCYDTCYCKNDLNVAKSWYISDFPNIISYITENNLKLIENSKELHKINNSIKILTSKRDNNDTYMITLKEAIKEAENEVLKYKDSSNDIDIEKYKKATKNLNIIIRQYNSYSNTTASSNVISDIYNTKTQLEKSVEHYSLNIKIKLQTLVENYMIEMDNGDKENASKIFKELKKYNNIIDIDEYEKIYKNKCEQYKLSKQVVTKEVITSKYTQSIIKKD